MQEGTSYSRWGEGVMACRRPKQGGRGIDLVTVVSAGDHLAMVKGKKYLLFLSLYGPLWAYSDIHYVF